MSTVTATELCQLLDRALEHEVGEVVLAFDGDGTLWSGDVGEDVFHYATKHQLLTEYTVDALRCSAESFALNVSGSASDIAAQLFQAYKQGRYPEHVVCEVMAWCYAGLTPRALEQMIDLALGDCAILERAQQEVQRVLCWARARQLTCVIVSASPSPVVTRAARHWGFEPSQIIAAIPAIRDGKYAPRLATALPYGSSKAVLARAHAGARRWLAAFGDNIFDWEMLQAATYGVAVRPKEALRRRLTPQAKILLLNPE